MSGVRRRAVGGVVGWRPRGLLAIGLGFALLLAAAGPAQAFTLTSLSISPATTLAAAHPNVTIGTSFSYSDSSDTVQSLQVYFPAGLVGGSGLLRHGHDGQSATAVHSD